MGTGGHVFAVPAWATPLSATLIHGGFAHLAFNLLMLVYCGMAIERVLGTGGVVILYLAGAYAAALGHYAVDPDSSMPMIGASGGASAIVATYALLFGRNRARAIGPVPDAAVHVIWLAAAWIGIQLLVGVASPGGLGVIAIGAHIGGVHAGLALTRPLLAWRNRGA